MAAEAAAASAEHPEVWTQPAAAHQAAPERLEWEGPPGARTQQAPQVSEKSTERVPGQILSNEFLGLKSECAGGRTYSESTRRNSVTPAKSHKFQSKLRSLGGISLEFRSIFLTGAVYRGEHDRASCTQPFVFLGTVFQKPTKTPGESVAAVSPGTSTAAIHQSTGRPRPRSAPSTIA